MHFLIKIETPRVKESPLNKYELLGKQRYIVTLKKIKVLQLTSGPGGGNITVRKISLFFI